MPSAYATSFRINPKTMQTVHSVTELRQLLGAQRQAGKRIAFVPTMGNLHGGHASLLEAAKAQGDYLVASVYVNPLQFGLNEDYEQYPRTLEDDQRVLEQAQVDLLFAPTDEEMYPNGMETSTKVRVEGLTDILCGAHRPGHFEGIATVVSMLFNLVQPDVAVFGRKDYQQYIMLRRMVTELRFPVEIVGAPTVREDSGLAQSSRNRYLTQEERTLAPQLYATLKSAADKLRSDGAQVGEVERWGFDALEAAGFEPDYFEVRCTDLSVPRSEDEGLVILSAAWLGKARLIDNIELASLSD